MSSRKSLLLSLLDKDPKSSFLLFALAKEFEAENNTASAIITYEKLLALDPMYTGAYYHLGKQYILINDLNKARAIYHAGIEICNSVHASHDASELRSALEDINEDEDF